MSNSQACETLRLVFLPHPLQVWISLPGSAYAVFWLVATFTLASLVMGTHLVAVMIRLAATAHQDQVRHPGLTSCHLEIQKPHQGGSQLPSEHCLGPVTPRHSKHCSLHKA